MFDQSWAARMCGTCLAPASDATNDVGERAIFVVTGREPQLGIADETEFVKVFQAREDVRE